MNILVKEVFGVQTDVTGSCRTEEGRVKPDTKNRILSERDDDLFQQERQSPWTVMWTPCLEGHRVALPGALSFLLEGESMRIT